MTKGSSVRLGRSLMLALVGASILTACRGGQETAEREAKTDTTAVAADTTPASADTTRR